MASFENWFGEFCQQHAKKTRNGCDWNPNWNSNRFGCSSFVGSTMEAKGYKPACIIHDMCYDTGRSQRECDDEFYSNLRAMKMSAPAAQVIWQAVSDHGNTHPITC